MMSSRREPLSAFRRAVKRWFGFADGASDPRVPRRSRLRMQSLEDRTVPAMITVTNALDTVAVDGSVSLREALDSINAGAVKADVTAAGAFGSNDTVVFQSCLAGPIQLPAGQLTIAKSVSITGPGSAALTVQNTRDPGAAARIFNITGGTFSISGLKLRGGDATTNGGAIASAGDLTLTDVTVSGNATTANGVGVAITGGSYAMTNSTVSGNAAGSGSSQGAEFTVPATCRSPTPPSPSRSPAARSAGTRQARTAAVSSSFTAAT